MTRSRMGCVCKASACVEYLYAVCVQASCTKRCSKVGRCVSYPWEICDHDLVTQTGRWFGLSVHSLGNSLRMDM